MAHRLPPSTIGHLLCFFSYSSIRSRFGICSRNLELKVNPESSVVKTLLEMGVEEKLMSYQKNIALQGEFIGPKIQAYLYKLENFTWKIFDVYLIDLQRYATRDERIQILTDLG